MRGTNDFFEILLGATAEGTLIFADLSLRTSPDRKMITPSVSFSEVHPIEANYAILEREASGLLDQLDAYDILSLLEDYDCAPSQLLDIFLEDQLMNYGVEGILDISLYPQGYDVEGFWDEIYFNSIASGQMDERSRLNSIDKDVTKLVFYLWDNYHLEKMSILEASGAIDAFDAIKRYHGQFDEDSWIQNWLETNSDNISIHP